MKILAGVSKVYHSSVKRLVGATSIINSCAVEIKAREKVKEDTRSILKYKKGCLYIISAPQGPEVEQ